MYAYNRNIEGAMHPWDLHHLAYRQYVRPLYVKVTVMLFSLAMCLYSLIVCSISREVPRP